MKRIVIRTVVILCVLFLGGRLIMWFPEPFFHYREAYGNFIIHSNEPFTEEGGKVLDAVGGKVSRCAHYDPEVRHRIFVSPPGTLHHVLMFPRNRYYAFNSTVRHNIFLFQEPDFEHNRLVRPSTGVAYLLDQVIAHEITHTFVREDLPFWKKEGYAEYIANYRDGYVSSGDFGKNVMTLFSGDEGDLLTNEFGIPRPFPYFRARVLVEYLFLVQGLSFEEFVADPVTEDVLLGRLRDFTDG